METLLKNLELLARAKGYQIGQREDGNYYVETESGKALAEISEDRLGVQYYAGDEYHQVEVDMDELEELKNFVNLLRE